MRILGSTGLKVSEVGFGAWQLGNNDAWSGMDDDTALKLIDQALDEGINLFDTAPNYAATNSERLLGEALRGKREGVVLITKFGHPPTGPKNFSVDLFWQSLHDSLQRLQTDYIDVLLLHNPPLEMYEGIDPLWSALVEAQDQGKIRHFGASLDFAQEVEACLNNTKSEVLEILFNILHQDVRRAFPIVRKKNAGTIVKVPLDSGWLTGRFNERSSFKDIRSRWSEEDIARRADLISRLDWLTVDNSCLAHKSIAYLLSYDEISCVIPGIRTAHQLENNLAVDPQSVTPQDRRKLEQFWDDFTHGGKTLLPW